MNIMKFEISVYSRKPTSYVPAGLYGAIYTETHSEPWFGQTNIKNQWHHDFWVSYYGGKHYIIHHKGIWYKIDWWGWEEPFQWVPEFLILSKTMHPIEAFKVLAL